MFALSNAVGAVGIEVRGKLLENFLFCDAGQLCYRGVAPKSLLFRSPKVGACAMTTKALNNKFALSNIDCHGVSQEKLRFWTIFLSAPSAPPPLRNANCISIVVLPSLIKLRSTSFQRAYFRSSQDLYSWRSPRTI